MKMHESGMRKSDAAQEVAAQEVAKGGTLADAYRSAYPRASKWRQSALYSEASKLSTNTKVSQRIAALKESAAGGNVSVRISDLKKSAAGSAAVSAEKLVREMQSTFSDVKVQSRIATLKEAAEAGDRVRPTSLRFAREALGPLHGVGTVDSGVRQGELL